MNSFLLFDILLNNDTDGTEGVMASSPTRYHMGGQYIDISIRFWSGTFNSELSHSNKRLLKGSLNGCFHKLFLQGTSVLTD